MAESVTKDGIIKKTALLLDFVPKKTDARKASTRRGVFSTELGLLDSVKQMAFNSNLAGGQLLGHRLRRLDRIDGLQPGRIALKAAQQSSQALSFDRNNDTIYLRERNP